MCTTSVTRWKGRIGGGGWCLPLPHLSACLQRESTYQSQWVCVASSWWESLLRGGSSPPAVAAQLTPYQCLEPKHRDEPSHLDRHIVLCDVQYAHVHNATLVGTSQPESQNRDVNQISTQKFSTMQISSMKLFFTHRGSTKQIGHRPPFVAINTASL